MSQNYVCQNCCQTISKSDIQSHSEICKNSHFKQTFRRVSDGKDTISKDNKSNPYYEMNDGMLTFGRSSNPESHNIEKSSSQSNIFKKSNTIRFSKESPSNTYSLNIEKTIGMDLIEKFIEKESDEKDFSVERDYVTNVPDKFGGIGIINSISDNNSFLSVVVHTVWNLQLLRNYLIYDVDISEFDNKNKLILELKNCLSKYSQNLNSSVKQPIDISKLRSCLSEMFQSRRKFLMDHPDDPIDAYFVILNSLHSFSIKKPLNEINDTSCNSKCFTHKYIWMDILKNEECECKGSSKRLFSNHNYIFDIPILKIFEISDSFNKIEMDKCFKLKTSRLSEEFTRNVYDIKGKLFLYLKALISQNSSICPEKGLRCTLNQIHKQLYLTNIPYYLSFSLNTQSTTYINNAMHVLKTLILIPKIFDINLIFEHSNENIYYEFLGCILRSNNRTYSCLFFQKNFNTKEWIYYVDEQIYYFKCFYEVLCRILKNQEMPILLIYQQLQENYNMDIAAAEKDLTEIQVEILENYAKNIENTPEILSNQFRPIEEIIKIEYTFNSSNSIDENIRNSNGNAQDNKFKRISSNNNNSTNINSSNFLTNTSQSGEIEYVCTYCGQKNKLENKNCLKCKGNNENNIKEFLIKKKNTDKSIDIKADNINESVSKTQSNVFKQKTLTSNLSANNIIVKNLTPSPGKEPIRVSPETNYKHMEIPPFDVKIKLFEDEKHMNMPKQMKTNDTNKENSNSKKIEKSSENSQNNILCKNCSKDSNKCQCEKKKYKNSKNSEDDLPEDRLKPYTNPRKENITSPKDIDSEWICSSCKIVNKKINKKCTKCQKVFSSKQNSDLENPLKSTPVLSSLRPSTSYTQRNLSEKQKIDIQEQNLKNNQSPKNLFKKSSECICFKVDDEKLFVNNVCKLCKKLRCEKSVRNGSKEIPISDKKQQGINQNNLFMKTKNLTPDINESKINYFNPNHNQIKKYTEVKVTNINNNNININNNYITTNKIDRELIKDNFKIKNTPNEALRFEVRSNSLGHVKKDLNYRYNEFNEIQPLTKKNLSSINLDQKTLKTNENIPKHKIQTVDSNQTGKSKNNNIKNEMINTNYISKYKK